MNNWFFYLLDQVSHCLDDWFKWPVCKIWCKFNPYVSFWANEQFIILFFIFFLLSDYHTWFDYSRTCFVMHVETTLLNLCTKMTRALRLNHFDFLKAYLDHSFFPLDSQFFSLIPFLCFINHNMCYFKPFLSDFLNPNSKCWINVLHEN